MACLCGHNFSIQVWGPETSYLGSKQFTYVCTYIPTYLQNKIHTNSLSYCKVCAFSTKTFKITYVECSFFAKIFALFRNIDP